MWVLVMVVVRYVSSDTRWDYGRRRIGWFSTLIENIFIKNYYLQYTNFLSLGDKVIVLPVYNLRKMREIKAASVLKKLPCS